METGTKPLLPSVAALGFSILPAYYQTTWFRALCGAALLLLLWFIYQFRLRQLRHQFNIGLEAQLNERTRIARDFHDTYLQTIQGSKLVADSALKQSPDPTPMRSAMEQLSVWLGRATEEGWATLNSLRTSATEKNDLAAAFQRAIEECRINSSVAGSPHHGKTHDQYLSGLRNRDCTRRSRQHYLPHYKFASPKVACNRLAPSLNRWASDPTLLTPESVSRKKPSAKGGPQEQPVLDTSLLTNWREASGEPACAELYCNEIEMCH